MMRPFPVLALLAILALPFTTAAFMSTPAAAAEKAGDAETVIRGIYAQYSKDGWPEDAEKKTFSPSLLAKWDEVQQAADAANEVGVDFDVFLDAQDTDTVTNLSTKFTPDGADLRLDLPIALYEAVLGGKVRVPTLDGAVELAIPAGTNSGRTFRLKGKGLKLKDGGKTGFGDLLATVRIVLPEGADPELNELMKKWRDKKPYDPRKDEG